MTTLKASSSKTTTSELHSSELGNPQISKKDVTPSARHQSKAAEDFDKKNINHSTLENKVEEEKSQDTPRSEALHPFVFWSQTATHISIRVDLVQAQEVKVVIEQESDTQDKSKTGKGQSLKFSALGKGAHGLQKYYFEIVFFADIEQSHTCHIIERYVLLLITKSDPELQWKRLTKQPSRFAWLRVDFDRYANSEDSDTDREAEALARDRQAYEQLRDSLIKNSDHHLSGSASDRTLGKSAGILSSTNQAGIKDNSHLFSFLNRRRREVDDTSNMKYDYRKESVSTDNGKNTIRYALDCKKTYLFIYNLIMFIMFLKVYIVLLIKGISGGMTDDIVEGAAFIIKILTFTQLLETIHPILGLVPGGPLMPFTQVVGRLIVNYFLAEPKIRIDAAPYAHFLLMVWSTIEIFRYSYYALRVFKVNIYFLTWCRYTLFLPLYPMGGFGETMIILSTIKHFEDSGKFSVSLPNPFNISFDPSIALKLYIYLLLAPSIYQLMRYMWRQRCKQLVKEKVG